MLNVELDGTGADDGDEVDGDEVGDVVGVVEAVVDDVDDVVEDVDDVVEDVDDVVEDVEPGDDVVVDELVVEELPLLHEPNKVATITSQQKPMTTFAFG